VYLYMDLTLQEGYWMQFCLKLITVVFHDDNYSQFYRPS
jgi:hypothetical protein